MRQYEADDRYMSNRRADQMEAWYAGADAMLDALMRSADLAMKGKKLSDQDKAAMYKLASAQYNVGAQEAFAANPFAKHNSTARKAVLPAPKNTPPPTPIDREPDTAEREQVWGDDDQD